jgi:uncharacterized protein (TIGR00725 family)
MSPSVDRTTLRLDRARRTLRDGAGRVFDLGSHTWRSDAVAGSGEAVGAAAAVAWLQRESGRPAREPIGVVGGRHATHAQLAVARALGAGLAHAGLVVLCGGRGGVMLAVCEGVADGGGISVGLLPGDTIADGNDVVTIPLPTGIGLARNALIARAARCLVAIGGSYGTLSEVAFALQYGKRVFGLEGAPAVGGVAHLPDVDAAIDAVGRVVLGLDPDPYPPAPGDAPRGEPRPAPHSPDAPRFTFRTEMD